MADFSEPFPTAYPCPSMFSAVYLRVQFFRHLFCVFDLTIGQHCILK